MLAKLNLEQVGEAGAQRCESLEFADRQTLKVWHDVSNERSESPPPEQVDAGENEVLMEVEEAVEKEVGPSCTSDACLRFVHSAWT